MPVKSNSVVDLMLICSIFFGGSECLLVTGPCRDLPVEQQFNLSEYMGLWYQVKHYEPTHLSNGDCNTAHYTLNATTMEVTYHHTMRLPDHRKQSDSGQAWLPDATSGEAKMKLRSDYQHPQFSSDDDYWVLGTDYQHYAVVWSCTSYGVNSSESAWILSRSPVLDQSVETLVDSIVRAYLQPEQLRPTLQGDECSSASFVKVSSVLLIVVLAILRIFEC